MAKSTYGIRHKARYTKSGISHLMAISTCLLLSACGPSVGPMASDLNPPRAALMVAPKPLPDVPKGEDLIQAGNQCSAEYVRETAKLRSLQTYVRTVLKK